MSAPAATSPREAVAGLFAALDALDMPAIEAMLAAEPQAVDELSVGWLRGREALHQYLSEMQASQIADMRSEVGDLHVSEWGDTAAVTCMLDQTYTLDGEQQTVHAPTTVLLRREGVAWRIALLHSVPLAAR
jgi:ketosteroid isomerase-like protein